MHPSNRVTAALRPWLCVLVAGIVASVSGIAAERAKTPVEATRAAVEVSNLDESSKQVALAQLETAQSEAREADALEQQLADLRTEAASQPARAEQLQKALAVDRDQALKAWDERPPKRADPETLERVLAGERATIATLDAQIDDVGAELVAAWPD